MMKLTMNNLGKIATAELEVRPLTVFIGPNNTQKTWTAYALYGLANALSLRSSAGSLFPLPRGPAVQLPDQLTANIERVVARVGDRLGSVLANAPGAGDGPSAGITIPVSREELVAGVSGPLRLELLPAGLAETLTVLESDVSNARVALEILAEEFKAEAQVSRAVFSVSGPSPVVETSFFNPENREFRQGTFLLPVEPSKRLDGLRQRLREELRVLTLSLFQKTVPFPAERKTLISIYKILQEGMQRDALFPTDSAGLGSPPLVAFLNLIRHLDALASYRPLPGDSEFASLAARLEEEVLGGNLSFTGEGPGARLAYTPGDVGKPLGMQASASLVRALAGLDLYLKHLATRSDFLIIDEPEMNAHPEAQLTITELLGLLVNKGIRIVLTTHSPYVIDHLNNLIEASRLDEEKQQAIHSAFKLQTREAFLAPDQVGVYFFDDAGGVHDVFDRENLTLDWSTFSKQSNYASTLYGEILRLEEAPEAAEQKG